MRKGRKFGVDYTIRYTNKEKKVLPNHKELGSLVKLSSGTQLRSGFIKNVLSLFSIVCLLTYEYCKHFRTDIFNMSI